MLNPLRHPSRAARTCLLRKCVLSRLYEDMQQKWLLAGRRGLIHLTPTRLSRKHVSKRFVARIRDTRVVALQEEVSTHTNFDFGAQKSRILPDLDPGLARSRLFP